MSLLATHDVANDDACVSCISCQSFLFAVTVIAASLVEEEAIYANIYTFKDAVDYLKREKEGGNEVKAVYHP